MQIITATQLRTNTKDFFQTLEKGEDIDLLKGSKKVGKATPHKAKEPKIIDAKKLQGKIDRLNLPRLTMEEIDRRYMEAMMKKHG